MNDTKFNKMLLAINMGAALAMISLAIFHIDGFWATFTIICGSLIFMSTAYGYFRTLKRNIDLNDFIKSQHLKGKTDNLDEELQTKWDNRTDEEKVMDYFTIIYGSELSVATAKRFDGMDNFCAYHNISEDFVLKTIKKRAQKKKVANS